MFLQAAGIDQRSANLLAAAADKFASRSNGRDVQPGEAEDCLGTGAGLATAAGRLADLRQNLVDLAASFGDLGWNSSDRQLLALATLASIESPFSDMEIEEIGNWTTADFDREIAAELLGVTFLFNMINRVADARRVRLEFEWIRGFSPSRLWVERRFAWFAELLYDLTYEYRARHTSAELLQSLATSFGKFGSQTIPELFYALRDVPLVLEGMHGLISVNLGNLTLARPVWLESIAVATAAKASSGSEILSLVDSWLRAANLPPAADLFQATASENEAESSSAIRRQNSLKIANSAHVITEVDVERMHAIGLSDGQVLDITLGTAVFSALVIVEPFAKWIGLMTR